MAQFNATFTNGYTNNAVSKTKVYAFAYRVTFSDNTTGSVRTVCGFSETYVNAAKAMDATAARIFRAGNATIVGKEVVETVKS